MVDLETGSDGVAVVSWGAPGGAAVIDPEWLDAFAEAVAEAVETAAARGVVLASRGADFLSGFALDSILETTDARAAFAHAARLAALTRRMEACGKPFAAALGGSALGGGLEIALACHRRFAADSPGARFGFADSAFGLPPGAGGAQRFVRTVGGSAALALMLDGKRLAPRAAREAGLVDEVAAPERLLDAARAWVAANSDARQPWDSRGFAVPGGGPWGASAHATIAANAAVHARTRGNDPAARAILSAVYEGSQVDIDTALRADARRWAEVATGAAARNKIRTLHVHAGAADRLARRPAGAPRAEFRKAGVLGAGAMGAGIAAAAARAGLEVALLDRSPELAGRGKARAAAALARLAARGAMTEEARAAALARIAPAADPAALAGSELVVEAVFEDRAVKAEATARAEAALDANAVFASNTSTLPISGLAEASARPANFIGLHFFSPVERMRLAEIIRGRETSDSTLARAMDFARRLGKTPIVVNDGRGFYTSRVFATYVREGFAMLAEGAGPALIENAGRMAGMPVGPLAAADEVSLDLMRAVSAQTARDLGDSWTAPPGEEVLEEMAGRLGRGGCKAGKGFYDYPAEGRKRLWPGLAERFPKTAAQPDAADVQRRLLWVQSLEAARCLEEGVLETAADGDLGSVLGWGFPAHTGGALSLIDTVGIDDFVAGCDRLAQRHGARFAPPAELRAMAARGAGFYVNIGDQADNKGGNEMAQRKAPQGGKGSAPRNGPARVRHSDAFKFTVDGKTVTIPVNAPLAESVEWFDGAFRVGIGVGIGRNKASAKASYELPAGTTLADLMGLASRRPMRIAAQNVLRALLVEAPDEFDRVQSAHWICGLDILEQDFDPPAPIPVDPEELLREAALTPAQKKAALAAIRATKT